MKKPTISLFFLLFLSFLAFPLLAQETNTEEEDKEAKSNITTPKNMLEVGFSGGLGLVAGEVEFLPSYAVGIHFRKAIDYIFSLRGDFSYALFRGAESNDPFREFETTWTSGTLFGVVSLNSLRWNSPVRSSNLYFMLGAGAGSYNMDFKQTDIPRVGALRGAFTANAAGGLGMSFRLANKINIGIEHQVLLPFGDNSDLIDGFTFGTGGADVVNFTKLAVNFNIGNKSSHSEPLYWINPLQGVISDIDELKKRPQVSLDDADQDGVLDALDMEPDTPPGAVVDTKGRTLDSDRDGVPDYLDREPFYPPAEGEVVNEEGVVINPGINRSQGVTEDRVRELIDEALQQNGVINDIRSNATEWFLPMLHFNTDQFVIKYSDYGTLASIARILRANPGLRLVITGYADSSGAEQYNNMLSYNRSKSVIDHLVSVHNIGRGRLVLQWKGSKENLVPANANLMNRRVEFRLAGPGDVEMDPPGGKSGY